jgi:hypothetical protein
MLLVQRTNNMPRCLVHPYLNHSSHHDLGGHNSEGVACNGILALQSNHELCHHADDANNTEGFAYYSRTAEEVARFASVLLSDRGHAPLPLASVVAENGTAIVPPWLRMRAHRWPTGGSGGDAPTTSVESLFLLVTNDGRGGGEVAFDFTGEVCFSTSTQMWVTALMPGGGGSEPVLEGECRFATTFQLLGVQAFNVTFAIQ